MTDSLYNASFEHWPLGTQFMLEDTSQRTAAGWLNGPGVGGRCHVSRQVNPIGSPGLPFDCRYYMRCQWLTPGYEPGDDPWLTFLEYGQAHGAPPQGGVRQLAAKRVKHAVYLRVAAGNVPFRLIAWQSFGYGIDASPFIIVASPTIMVSAPNWTPVETELLMPPLSSKNVGSGGEDYLGWGLEIPSYYGPVIDVALPDRAECAS